MNTQPLRFGMLLGLLGASSSASAAMIDFDDLPVGTTLSNQYSGVTFTPNAFTGSGSYFGNWATNTGLTIVSATGPDVRLLGLPSLVSGNVVRSLTDWIREDGDPSVRINFASPVRSVSLTFAAVGTSGNTRLFAYDGMTLLGSVAAQTSGQLILSYSAPSITSLVVTPGDLQDYVAFDNLVYQAVPEPASWAMLIAGFGLTGAVARRRRGTLHA